MPRPSKKHEAACAIAQGLDPLLSVSEAAERMSTTDTHVRELIRTGRLTHVRVGRFIRIPTSAVTEFIASAMKVGR